MISKIESSYIKQIEPRTAFAELQVANQRIENLQNYSAEAWDMPKKEIEQWWVWEDLHTIQ